VNPACVNRPDHHPSGTGRAAFGPESRSTRSPTDSRSVNAADKSDRDPRTTGPYRCALNRGWIPKRPSQSSLARVVRRLQWLGMVERVNYEAAASRYNLGRSLSEATIANWQAAVSPHVPARPLVVDLGAGTGLWAQVWVGWGARSVVAVEPSPAMRREASAGRLPAEVRVVAGRGEHLPLRDGCAGVVWMSTVLHHLADREATASETRRVLDPGGVCLVRGFFADRSDNGWLPHFPGQERARASFPAITDTAVLFAQHGLALRHVIGVTSDRNMTLGEAAEWIRLMRSADSLLAAFTDEEIEIGLRALDAHASQPCAPNTLELLVLGPEAT